MEDNVLRPKICFVTTVPITLNTFVRPQTERLLADGWEVHWASAELGVNDQPLPVGVVHHILPISRDPSLLETFRAVLMLVMLFRRLEFSIVQYSTPIAALAACIAGSITRTPNRIYAQWGIRYVGFQGLRRIFFKALEKFTCNLSTVIQPDSFGNLRFSVHEKLYPERKGQVISHGSACGVDLVRYQLDKRSSFREAVRTEYNIAEDAFVFGFIGSIRSDKGINEMVRAFVSIQNSSDPSLILLLVGDRVFEGDLNADVQLAINSRNDIVLTGPVSDVERYVSAFDCLVFPSYREGFGMVVVEAAAMAVPAIVTDIPGPSEAVVEGETGNIVPLKDIKALKSIMRWYSKNPQKAKLYGYNSRIRVEQYYEQSQLMERYVENKRAMLGSSIGDVH